VLGLSEWGTESRREGHVGRSPYAAFAGREPTLDEPREHFVGILGLRPAHLELAGLASHGSKIVAHRAIGRVLLHPQQKLVLHHGRDRGEIGVLEGNFRDHRLLPCIRRSKDHFVWIACHGLTVGVALGAAATPLIHHDDRLVRELVLRDRAGLCARLREATVRATK
jgi:hypothetical protein